MSFYIKRRTDPFFGLFFFSRFFLFDVSICIHTHNDAVDNTDQEEAVSFDDNNDRILRRCFNSSMMAPAVLRFVLLLQLLLCVVPSSEQGIA